MTMREPNRIYIARGLALVIAVIVHGMIIRFLTTGLITVTTVSPVLVTFIDSPHRAPLELTFPALVLRKPNPLLIAVPQIAVETPVAAVASGADALRHLIATIRTVALRYDHDLRGPLPPIHLLAKLGAVQSIQFLGIESRGLDVNEATQTIDPGSRDSRKLQWKLYKVTQQGGVSEWLIAVTRNGTIKIAQALTCPASCPGF